jgi:hypothetical protein
MANNHLYMLAKTNIDVIILLILGSLIVVFGGIAVYLVEHEHGSVEIISFSQSFVRVQYQ